MDLADGHLKALQAMAGRAGMHTWNLGSGQGCSVFEVVRAFERASGRLVPYRVAPRRPGDAAASFADPSKAIRELGRHARRGLAEMRRDTWRWPSMNPSGFSEG